MAKWFPQQAISRIHGTVKEADGRLIVPMYHPAAALHQGSLRQVLLDDFAKLPAILERARKIGPHPPTPSPDSASLAGEGERTGLGSDVSALGEDVRQALEAEDDSQASPLAAAGPHPPTPSPDSASLAGEGESAGSEAESTLLATHASTAASPDAPSILPSPATQESGEGPGVRADSQELTAEEEAPSAAKSGQLSLFE
jgi:hypothetical protein